MALDTKIRGQTRQESFNEKTLAFSSEVSMAFPSVLRGSVPRLSFNPPVEVDTFAELGVFLKVSLQGLQGKILSHRSCTSMSASSSTGSSPSAASLFNLFSSHFLWLFLL